MKRSEIDEKYLWNLTDLFEDDDKWELSFKEVKDETEAFKKFKGKLLESPETLFEAIRSRESISRKLTDLVTYSRMKLDENTKSPTYQGLVSRSETLMTEISDALSFFNPELLSVEFEIIEKMLAYEPLQIYRQAFEDLFRSKPHTLSEEMESVLAQTEELAGVPSNAYGMLLNADMTFEDVTDSEGKTHKLTNGTYVPLLMGKDRVLREDAFNKYYKVYESHINTIATLMQSEVKKNIFYSKMRKHSSSRAAALFENNIPVSVPDQLIEAVNANLETFYKYMKLRKRVLGLEELHLYDV
ncbi:MAG: oligoendopeptidase F, partial [Bacillota bacterium]|nr:oligoendopeptidase F [Bacillota bacterium]